jgi:methyl-accepting chemotaxis protein
VEAAMKPGELEPWLRETLRPQLAATEKSILKAGNEVQTQLSSLKEIVADLSNKSQKDSSEKRSDRAAYRSAKATSRMCEELQGLLSDTTFSTAQSYEALKQFAEEVSKLAGDAAKIRDKWVGPIRPYYILDMMSLNASIDKLRRLGEQAWTVFSKEGELMRRLEEIHNRVERIEEFQMSLEKELGELGRATREITEVDARLSEASRELESLLADKKFAALKGIDARLRELRAELLTSGFRRLGRPLRKLEAMTSRGEYAMAPELRETLAEYLKRPFLTFVGEADGYPSLKAILNTLREAIDRKRLVLKQREERKVLERIDNVSEKNVLANIHHEAGVLFTERRKSLQNDELRGLVRAYRQGKQELKDLQTRRSELEHRGRLLSERTQSLTGSLKRFAKDASILSEKLCKKSVTVQPFRE